MKKSSSEEFKKRIRELENEVTRRRIAEETLKKENIFFNSPYSITLFDANGHYVMGNQAFIDLFGNAPPPEYSLFDDPIIKKAGFQEQVLKLKKGEIIKTPIEFWYNPHDVRPDLPDKKVYTKAVAFPVMDNNGKVENIVIMHEDITERKQIEKKLKATQKELEIKTRNLEDINTALNVLLKHQDEKKHELETSIITSLNNLILPYIEKLKSCTTDDRHKTYINIIETNLLEITKPFLNHMKGFYAKLTPTETQIANLIRENKTSKDIADILYISETTVFFHRRNIRNKLGIKNKKTNLCSYLQSFQGK